ncbi:DUF3180 domain-containing protein [Phytoactinopolyspora limicola]|uniref:DUF3180 domain-containing protein n=1 Tax=Phytoactinopolyspora limicola TaxID=2715536 RepID=UPI0014075B4B|nr:DUF3180 domain-containing protein [Phytoactinopolyspora limicola]
MQKTKLSALAWTALIAVPIGWSISRLVHNSTGALPLVPAVLLIFIAILAVMMFIGARLVRGWIEERRYDRYFHPLRVARILALAKASEFFGAALAGGYVGLAVLSVDHLGSPMGRDALVRAALMVGAALAATVTAMALEHACLVPSDDDRGTDT